MKELLKVGISLEGNKLHVFNLQDPSERIQVEQLVFDATSAHGQVAEGYAVSIHGLPLEMAGDMPLQLQRQLGVGAQLNPLSRGKAGHIRFRACAGDNKFKRVRQ